MEIVRRVRTLALPALVRIDGVSLCPEALEFVDQGAAADAKGFGRLRPVEVMLAQCLDDGLAFDLPQTLGILRLGCRSGPGSGADFRAVRRE